MSEEKLDKIDRRLTELVNITGNLVTAVRDLVAKVDDNTETLKQQSETLKHHTKQIEALTEHQKLMSNQLSDVARVVINNSKKQDEMKEDVDKRITNIEEKIAA